MSDAVENGLRDRPLESGRNIYAYVCMALNFDKNKEICRIQKLCNAIF